MVQQMAVAQGGGGSAGGGAAPTPPAPPQPSQPPQPAPATAHLVADAGESLAIGDLSTTTWEAPSRSYLDELTGNPHPAALPQGRPHRRRRALQGGGAQLCLRGGAAGGGHPQRRRAAGDRG
eukprot:6976661-Prymnesium_polylepis.1